MNIMKYAGIDYGEKRVGIAVCDEAGSIAFPRGVVANKTPFTLIKDLRAFFKKEGTARIIIGLPILPDGRETDQTRRVRQFGSLLRKKTGYKVFYEDEKFTTRMARRYSSAKNHDGSSAALILQSYLDKKSLYKGEK